MLFRLSEYFRVCKYGYNVLSVLLLQMSFLLMFLHILHPDLQAFSLLSSPYAYLESETLLYSTVSFASKSSIFRCNYDRILVGTSVRKITPHFYLIQLEYIAKIDLEVYAGSCQYITFNAVQCTGKGV